MESSAHSSSAKHVIVRQRHELKKRSLIVSAVHDLSPRMRRVVLTSPELADFQSLSPDDHVKIFFPSEEGEQLRDFTPRMFDVVERTLTIDFALHESGIATRWATQATVGQRLSVGGPRGSRVVPDDFDWYAFFGDETALPAIGRWVESLRPQVPVLTVVVIADESETQQLQTRADHRAVWIPRGQPSEEDSERLLPYVERLASHSGDGFVWIAGEAHMVGVIRDQVLATGHPRDWLEARGYWKRGETDVPIDSASRERHS
jgi:NADPH-dependent ferric siderophore reductase